MTKVESIIYLADVENMLTKIDKLELLYETGEMDFNLIRYIPGLANIAYQGQIYSLQTKKKYASETYAQKNNLEFEIVLSANEYTNFNNILICFLIKIKSKANSVNDIAAGTIPVNNFFAHWLKEVYIKRYGDDISILPLKTVEVYRYSDDTLKHMPGKAFKMLETTLLHSKKKVALAGN